ncbi:MAG: peptide ABC transporter substrate-binding protein [Nitrospina sp.]|jgi:ABC-type transport system substrate-binding protein|nr:peptide ABC transporter substrate-binding protein [Nitrospina sp.]MBT3510229.1 peptide ABC transporter substrate-binding protein [Nitrospina sp.]MBT3876802.1 peptide ABC transporter substrate-binding protein [Nitrospina sp.]MBT4048158.1 peptide ABC transporter substrate-binding protein [Nitrospina sp.]MBT4556844.1 peptide ABC transporter substrate-binding protein [Nitrospina sp.]
MNVKKILIYLPLALTIFLLQSFFWVPTYDKQAVGNPARLVKYVQGSSGDAQILNPILSADTSSSSINELVFDGLIDLDLNLEYRPRLAESWSQFEEAYLTLNTAAFLPGGRMADTAQDWPDTLLRALKDNSEWTKNLRSIEVIPEETIKGEIEIPQMGADSKPGKIFYTLHQPPRLKFTLEKIDQDFFIPIKKWLGEDYFNKFPYEQTIRAKDDSKQVVLRNHYEKILPLTEHNPVIVFDLKKNVTFHDGHPFDSGDVLFTFNSIMNPKGTSPRKSDYEPVKEARVLGPHKIRFTYKRLFSPAIGSWAMGILPEHLLTQEKLLAEAKERGRDPDTFTLRDSNFGRHPIGTGPFIFKEWKSDEQIRLVRNEKYWEGAPEYEEYVMRIIPDSLTQEMEFYAGAVDNYSVQPHQVARFSTDDKYQSFSSIGYFYSYIGYNLRNPLFADRDVRVALGMAIDIDPIIQYILYGEGERVTGPYPKITDWYDPEVKPLPYDPKAALEILNRIGWKKNSDGWLEKDGKIFEFNLITNSGNPIRKNILTIVQESWRKIGIKCNTQLFEWAVFLKDFVNALKYDALVLGWSMGIDPDLYQIWHSSQAGPRQLNFVGYKNAKADRLITRIRREYDRTKQISMARELHRMIAHDQPYTFLYVAKSTQLLDKKIVIVETEEGGEKKYQKIYPTKDGRIRYYFNKWKKLAKIPAFSPAS